MREMGRNARIYYEQKLSPDKNYEMLLKIYEAATNYVNYKNSGNITWNTNS